MKSPKNAMYAVIPFFIGLLVFFLGFYLSSDIVDSLVSRLFAEQSFFADWPFLKAIAEGVVLLLTWMLVAFLNFIAGYLCLIVVAGPFYALMVENIFRQSFPEHSSKTSVRVLLSLFFLSLLKVIVFLVAGLFCFFLSFIPPFGFVVPIILGLLVAYDCVDYAFEIDYLSLRQRGAFFSQHFFEFLGLGLAILGTSLVPGLFFVLLPIFICGATKMYTQLRMKTV